MATSYYRSRKARLHALSAQLRHDGWSWGQVARRIAEDEGVNPLVAMRLAHGLSQSDVADQWNQLFPDRPSPMTYKTVSLWESWPSRSGRQPTVETLRTLARIYGCRVSDLLDDVDNADEARERRVPPDESTQVLPRDLHQPDGLSLSQLWEVPSTPSMQAPESVLFSATGGEDGLDAMFRRAFLLGMSACGIAVGGLPIGRETLRHSLNTAVADRASVDLADWHAITLEYGAATTGATSDERIDALTVDLLGLQLALQQSRSPQERRELHIVGARLAGYMAGAVGHRDVREARRWWRSARQSADASGDCSTMAYIRGREAIRAIYEQRPPREILGLVAKGEAVGGKASTSLPSLHAARAQTLAMVGRGDEAEAALERLRTTFAALPSAMTNNHAWHHEAYPEERVRHTESFVYSHLGRYRQAERAQLAAQAFYPHAEPNEPAKIELHRALCLVNSGDPQQGARHALNTLETQPRGRRTSLVLRSLGHDVLNAVPARERVQPAVIDLRDYLTPSTAAT